MSSSVSCLGDSVRAAFCLLEQMWSFRFLVTFLFMFSSSETQSTNRKCDHSSVLYLNDKLSYIEQLLLDSQNRYNEMKVDNGQLRSELALLRSELDNNRADIVTQAGLAVDVSHILSNLTAVRGELFQAKEESVQTHDTVAILQSELNANYTAFRRDLDTANDAQRLLTSKLVSLQAELVGIAERNDQFSANLSNVLSGIGDTGATVFNLQVELAYISSKTDEVPRILGSLERRLNGLDTRYSQLRSSLDSLEGELNTVVAFTVYPRFQRTYRADRVIIFDTILTNFGRHFNTNNNRFTCPHHGMYMFSISVHSPAGTRIDCVIAKNDAVIVSALADAGAGDSHGSHASGVVMTECRRGEQVLVKTADSTGVLMGGLRSAFSGFLTHRLT